MIVDVINLSLILANRLECERFAVRLLSYFMHAGLTGFCGCVGALGFVCFRQHSTVEMPLASEVM